MTPDQLQQILLKNNLLKPQEHIIIGISGGPDSVALFHLLCECKLDLIIEPVYVDHGLRPDESPKEIEFVKDLADRYHLHCQITAVDTLHHKKKHGCSLEESARLLRYKALQSSCTELKASCIAIAHTADDQAEEILLRLFRGTGLKGLSGMAMKNDNVIRPLLTTPKIDLLNYLAENKIPYCTDSSNSDRSFLRNKIRLDLLPAIAEHINSSIRSTLLRTAEILREDESFLDEFTQAKIRYCLQSDFQEESKTVDLNILNNEHLAIQRRIIEKVLWQFSSPPSFKHIDNILALAKHGCNGAELHLPMGVRVYKSRQELCFSQPQGKTPLRGSIDPVVFKEVQVEKEKSYVVEELNRELRIEKLLAPPLELKEGTLLLDAKNLVWPLTLRSPKPGDHFSPHGMEGKKKISRFLSDQKIPKRDRDLHPVLISNGNIVAVVGLRVENTHAVDSSTKEYILVRWLLHDAEMKSK
jgi:tRNA(Ile)-lysidine synthase